MECITIGLEHIRGYGKGKGWGGKWQRLKQRSKTTQMVEFRVVIMFPCTNNGPIFHYKAYTDVY